MGLKKLKSHLIGILNM